MLFGIVLIEVCDGNAACVPELLNLESEFVGVSILENSCMSQCELCAIQPYVFLDGEIISSHSVEELLHVIREKLK